ncbi:MAG: sigma-70 family RNA polymerase sigma factor [Chthoniobacteraceae bacterium]
MTASSLPFNPLVSSPQPAQSAFPVAPLAGIKDARAMEQDQSRREDEELVARAQTGDAAAFDALVIKHSPRLYALVYNMTANHEDTNDLLQDVWTKAYRSIGGFRGKSQFYTWLHSVAANTTVNFLKKRGRRWTMSLDDVDNGILQDKEFVELQANSTPVRETDLGEMQQRITEAMMKLTPEHRAVVTMFDIQGMPHSDIAKILGISEGTVRSRLFYAHKQLQAWLSEFAPVHSNPA